MRFESIFKAGREVSPVSKLEGPCLTAPGLALLPPTEKSPKEPKNDQPAGKAVRIGAAAAGLCTTKQHCLLCTVL